MFENIGSGEILLVLIVAFLFFGPKKLPEIGQTLGKATRQFREAMKGVQRDIESAIPKDLDKR